MVLSLRLNIGTWVNLCWATSVKKLGKLEVNQLKSDGSNPIKPSVINISVVIKPCAVTAVEPSHTLFLLPSPCRHNEAYTWTNPTCCVHNIIVGQLWIEQYGQVEVINHK